MVSVGFGPPGLKPGDVIPNVTDLWCHWCGNKNIVGVIRTHMLTGTFPYDIVSGADKGICRKCAKKMESRGVTLNMQPVVLSREAQYYNGVRTLRDERDGAVKRMKMQEVENKKLYSERQYLSKQLTEQYAEKKKIIDEYQDLLRKNRGLREQIKRLGIDTIDTTTSSTSFDPDDVEKLKGDKLDKSKKALEMAAKAIGVDSSSLSWYYDPESKPPDYINFLMFEGSNYTFAHLLSDVIGNMDAEETFGGINCWRYKCYREGVHEDRNTCTSPDGTYEELYAFFRSIVLEQSTGVRVRRSDSVEQKVTFYCRCGESTTVTVGDEPKKLCPGCSRKVSAHKYRECGVCGHKYANGYGAGFARKCPECDSNEIRVIT